MLPTMQTYFLIQMLVLVSVSKGFLLDVSICSTGNSCRCTIDSIDCWGLELKDVPLFNFTGTNISISNIKFFYNEIDTLRNGSLNFLKNRTATSVSLYFQFNNLSAMEDGCFEEIKDVIVYLDLTNNNLHTIPMAISSLTHLHSLILISNPIIYFDPKVLSSIGDTLQRLEISLTKVSHWPNEFRFFFNLQVLKIFNFSAHTLSASDFQYMTHIKSLQKLSLQATDLVEFPVVLCDLSRLHFLNLDANNFTAGENDIFGMCHRPLANMSVIELRLNGLEYFPDFGKAFPAIKEINLSYNNIRYIPNELTAMPLLETLYLNNNKLSHIPWTLAPIAPSLEHLSVVQNLIVEIDNQALAAFQKLSVLDLAVNPLEYIADHAFFHNPDLKSLDLSLTKLVTIPCALSNAFNHVVNVYLQDHVIECDCRMKCLNNITLSGINFIDTPCQQTGFSFKQFIQNVIKADSCG